MKNLSLMKWEGLLMVFFCSLPFYSCETKEMEDVLLKNESVCEKKFVNGYIPNGNVKTLTLPNELKVSVDEAGNYFHEDIVFPKQVNVLHEVMHSLGFCHELSRNDRDKYVTVLYHNIDFLMQINLIKKITFFS